MKIYVNKEKLRDYIILPTPKNLEDYYEVEVEDNFNPKCSEAYNPNTGKFEPCLTFLAKQARKERDNLLAKIDTLVSNPLRWVDVSEEDKDKVIKYRKNLLNVPQQKNFPTKIRWPKIPEVLK